MAKNKGDDQLCSYCSITYLCIMHLCFLARNSILMPINQKYYILQSLRGHSCAREVQRKFFHKWLETYLRCKKIEGDRLKSWCGPRNPRWPPRWRPIFLKMTVYIKLATTTCFYLVFGLKMIILEEETYK